MTLIIIFIILFVLIVASFLFGYINGVHKVTSEQEKNEKLKVI